MLVQSVSKVFSVYGPDAIQDPAFTYSVASALHITELALRNTDLVVDLKLGLTYLPSYDTINHTVLNSTKKLIVFIKHSSIAALPSISTFDGSSGVFTFTQKERHVILDYKQNSDSTVIVLENKYIIKQLLKSDNIHLEIAKIVLDVHKIRHINLKTFLYRVLEVIEFIASIISKK